MIKIAVKLKSHKQEKQRAIVRSFYILFQLNRVLILQNLSVLICQLTDNKRVEDTFINAYLLLF